MKACLDCADIDRATAAILGRGGPMSSAIVKTCMEACQKCVEACGSGDEQMKECAAACQRCIDACKKV